jgi:putative tricarboxylic transport membrane protein
MQAGAPRRVIRAPQSFAAGVTLVVLAAFTLLATASLVSGRLNAMGPGMLPRVLAIHVGLAGAALVVLSLAKEGAALERWSFRGPFFVFAGIVAFALTIRTFGLVAAAPAVALVSGAATPDARPRELLVFTAVITAFSIALFKYALGLPIPVLIIPGVVVL